MGKQEKVTMREKDENPNRSFPTLLQPYSVMYTA
ncbi:unnamed protein product [Spirodela intermedia]|uniref:Uncharacterized protein n=1 Tax=Spirodela intermedia TaxID=51605 RepID=A0A7I8L7P8_SPIIN|nr:unnamed protein product [Spirodela intermedia]